MAGKKSSVLDKLESSLKGAKFRILNEILYRKEQKDINPELFKKYHEGYKEQVAKWPFNPVDRVIKQLAKSDANLVIADLGCGEAKIAKRFKERKVYSFDLVKSEDDDYITESDIRSVPLEDCSVDIAVFCLSLMGENVSSYVQEAYRILKPGGQLKVVEVRSRLVKIDHFIKPMAIHGFNLLKKDLESNFFCFFDFKKSSKKSSTLPSIDLKPCVYKKR